MAIILFIKKQEIPQMIMNSRNCNTIYHCSVVEMGVVPLVCLRQVFDELEGFLSLLPAWLPINSSRKKAFSIKKKHFYVFWIESINSLMDE